MSDRLRRTLTRPPAKVADVLNAIGAPYGIEALEARGLQGLVIDVAEAAEQHGVDPTSVFANLNTAREFAAVLREVRGS